MISSDVRLSRRRARCNEGPGDRRLEGPGDRRLAAGPGGVL